MSKYTDPSDAKELISRFSALETKEGIQEFIEEKLPGWLIASTDKYSEDYPHLQQNWAAICRMTNVRPQKIVVVDHVSFENDHSFLQAVCETMTRRGYVVRRKEEFTGCEVCRRAIPVVEVWRLLKEKGMPVPRHWSNTCSGCEASSTT
jgi:hypothetical protein